MSSRKESHLEETAHQLGRLADAVEELLEEQQHQNAVLTELARAQWNTATAANDYASPDDSAQSVPTLTSLQTNISDHDHERRRRDRDSLLSDGGVDVDAGEEKPTPPVPPSERIPPFRVRARAPDDPLGSCRHL